MPTIDDRSALDALESEMRSLRESLLKAEMLRSPEIEATHPSHRRAAANLVHYIELRSHDVRDLQTRLGELGLSSLGRSEAHVLATVEAILDLLARLNGTTPPVPGATIGVAEGNALLEDNATTLLGVAPSKRSTRIMVTLPSEAADDAALVEQMAASGMDIARINCAHDDAAAWERMIDHVRASVAPDGRPCLVAMDLAGPKLRTGPLQPGPQAMRVAPRRDRTGQVVVPAVVWITATGAPPPATVGAKVAHVPVEDAGWVSRRVAGDRLVFSDSRDAARTWRIIDCDGEGCLAETLQTTYLVTGLKLVCRSGEDEDAALVGTLPEIEQAHHIGMGDRVVLTRSLSPVQPSPAGTTHRIGCTLPEVFAFVKEGQRVWLDDGKIGGTVERVTDDELELVVTDVRPGGANLRGGKGINLPDTKLHLDALTPKDLNDLEFVARHADLVNYSFVRRAKDVQQLQSELSRLDAERVGIVLKIENVAGFENLPHLLLTAMRSENVGVMIARGDLAVEVGFARLAEVQEEILWACEAAHVPVIWATQVLDTLARTGQPSRAEVTDAAMSERAECVMLNKGPYIVDAIGALDSILSRMQHHQHKKRSLLRKLRAWRHDPQ